jgi:hypothetical protein
MPFRLTLTAVAGAAIATSASAGMTTFNFPLSGDQEVPAFMTDAFGTGELVYDSTAQTFDIEVFIENLPIGDLLGVGPNSTPIHIHNAPAGSNGGIAIDIGNLFSFVEDAGGIRFTGTDIPIGSFEDELFNAGLYVNVHTVNSGSGEVRGQIVPAPASAALLGLAGLGAARRRR